MSCCVYIYIYKFVYISIYICVFMFVSFSEISMQENVYYEPV